MQLPYSHDVEVGRLSRLFDNMSESYKLFWFQAIVNQVTGGKCTVSYEELVNDMIADAWYMVAEYKLNLGPSDNLEMLIRYAFKASGLKSSASRKEILAYLGTDGDKQLTAYKRKLIQNVPYRLQSPFLEGFRGKSWSVSVKALSEELNQRPNLIYYFGGLSGLKQTISVQPEWSAYILENQEILKGWIQFHLIEYLQRRNPNVPGIINKLSPPQERRLAKVRKYWKLVMEVKALQEIYGGETLTSDNLSIDHFVPWSYVAHDEFWNLNPTTRSVNSRKSNGLPEWGIYFPQLCKMEYDSYEVMWQYPRIHKEFEECRREHVNSDEVLYRLYRQNLKREEFEQNLKGILLPVYQAAQNIGFAEWEYRPDEADKPIL